MAGFRLIKTLILFLILASFGFAQVDDYGVITRKNVAGLGEEQVSNGTFNTDLTDWHSNNGNWSVVGGVCVADGNDSDYSLAQDNVVAASKSFRGAFDWTRTQGTFQIYYHNGSFVKLVEVSAGASGSEEFDVTIVGTPTSGRIYFHIGSGTVFTGTIDNVSFKEIL